MSAFLVGSNHITYMIRAALELTQASERGDFRWWRTEAPERTLDDQRKLNVHFPEPDDLQATGEMLHAENVKSMVYRYPNDDASDEEKYPPFVLGMGWGTDPYQAYEAVCCYEYQTCEHPEWPQSEAALFCHSLRDACLRELCKGHATKWGVPEPVNGRWPKSLTTEAADRLHKAERERDIIRAVLVSERARQEEMDDEMDAAEA